MSAAAGSRPNERPSEELRAARNEIERLRSELHQLREDEAAPLLDAATRGPQQQAAAERRGGGSGRALGALLAVLAVLGALLFASGALSLGPGRSGPPPPAQPPHDAQGRLVFLRSFVDQQVGVLGLLSYLDKPIPKPLSPRRSLLTGDNVLLLNTHGVERRMAQLAEADSVYIQSRGTVDTYPTTGGGEVTVLGNSFFDPDGQFVELNEVKVGSV